MNINALRSELTGQIHHIFGLVMIGLEVSSPKTALAGAAVFSITGAFGSSIKLASVTEAQAKEREAIASSAKRDLNDFMMYVMFFLSRDLW